MPPGLADHPYFIVDFSPFAFQLSESFGVRWYGLGYLLGLLAGWWWQKRAATKGKVILKSQEISDYAMAIGIGMIAGGRLGYCLFYQPELFITFTGSLPFWGVLAIHEGGMSSHGGIIGFFVASLYFSRKRGYPLWGTCDVVAAACGFGIVMVRLANFINGELWGRPTDGSWGFQFPASLGKIPYQVGSSDWYQYVATHADARHPSQLYAAFSEGLMLIIVSVVLQGRIKRPGFITAAVLATYSIGRIINEFFREPDPQFKRADGSFELFLDTFSRGQVLTFPILLAAIAMMIWFWKRGPREELYQAEETPQPQPQETETKQ